MKKILYYIVFLFLTTASLQAQQNDSMSLETRVKEGFNDLADLQLFFDARNAWRSINVSDTSGTANKSLATLLTHFFKETTIRVGLTESVETTNRFWKLLDETEPQGTYQEGAIESSIVFQLDFIPSSDNKRLYKINVAVKKSFAIETNGYIKPDPEEKWKAFDDYFDSINTREQTYDRADFKTAVNDIITKGIFILLGVTDFPLEVAILPDTTKSIDRITNAKYEDALYEKIIVNNKSKPVTNVALKQNDVLNLQTVVSRMEIDSIEKTITLGNGKNFNQKLSSFDSVKNFTYTATSTGDDAITATYELKFEDKTITETAGKLNVSVYQEEKFKVRIVPINKVGNINANELKTFLNAVYGQAIAVWEQVTVESNLTVNKFDDRLDAEMGTLSNYSPEMNSIVSAYKNSGRTIEKGVYYIFVVERFEDNLINGFMPLKRNYGFVAYNSDSDVLGRAIAHELGHGTFRLNHTFKEYPTMTKGSTYNLMDYPNSTPNGTEFEASKLYKYQWDYIHNPEGGVYWFQEEEDVMAILPPPDRYDYDPYLFLCSFFNDERRLVENLKVHSSKKVAIDPGHGDWYKAPKGNKQIDPGVPFGSDNEKDWVLNISIAMKDRLMQRGIEILMTREDDIIVEGGRIRWRLQKAHKDSCDIFVSIHLNSGGTNVNVNGFIVAYLKGQENSKKLAKRIAEKQTLFALKNIGTDGNRLDIAGVEYRPFDNGTGRAGVLSDFKGEASVLIEVGYITNQQDLYKIKTKYKQIGTEVADAVCDYIKYDSK
ncbi:MAG: N-acetylmuramoyl-L-alanine amidase [Bacteroidales bacterium]|jgi:N-acetylmuramoyl-L-alanine amidase|nr:N-acetylmuramoyl-L-alanine amidase [Bacteroidales bacterium]